MKKIFVAIALIAGLGTSVSFAATATETANAVSIELSATDYTPIEVKDLPQAIQETLAKNLSEYTVKSAAYQQDEDGVKTYLVTLVDAEGSEANVLFTENGEIIE
jgi:adenine C2-methylase RlmN of 23S rRNA A2503 and tRNA A37